MNSQKTCSVEEARQILKELKSHLPDRHQSVYDFAEFLAQRIDGESTPVKFVRACQLAILDLQGNVDSLNSKPVVSKYGYPRAIFKDVMQHVPAIAATIFLPPFVNGVQNVVQEMNGES